MGDLGISKEGLVQWYDASFQVPRVWGVCLVSDVVSARVILHRVFADRVFGNYCFNINGFFLTSDGAEGVLFLAGSHS